ncbi:lytic enzyme [Vibrio coralliilyticus]|nr:lytic enzyme [Vibrio coralliilyticus]
MYGLTHPKVIAHFLSQVGHESKFKAATESLNYTAKRMREYFGCKGGKDNYISKTDDCSLDRLRNKLWTHESQYARNSKALANYVYANRMGNGDEESGDGYKYRGRGLIQITGRDKYQGLTAYHNKNNPDDHQDFTATPELVANNLDYAVSSAFYFWYKFKKIDNDKIKTASVEKTTLLVNGGYNGLKDRKERFSAVCKKIGI